MKPFLSVTIPTYKRPGLLLQRVLELVPQLDATTELRVFENGGTPELAAGLAEWPQVHYRPSKVNGGVYRNFLRCLEESEAEWIWILGDDDEVLPDALARICRWCRETDAQAILTRTWARPTRTHTAVASLQALTESIWLTEALFISGTIWRREALQRETAAMVEGAYSMCAQLLVLSRFALAGEKLLIVAEPLVKPNNTNHRWSRVELIQRSPTLADHLAEDADRKRLARWLWPDWWWAVGDALKEVNSVASFEEWRAAFWRGYGILRGAGACPRWFTQRKWLTGMARTLLGTPVHNPFLFAASLRGKLGLKVALRVRTRWRHD